MKRKKDSGKNTKFAIIFFGILIFIIFASLLYKTILLIGDSRFDGNHRFNVLVWDNKNIKVLSFSPEENIISVIRIQGERGGLDIYKFLEIPLDAHIITNNDNFNKDIKKLLLESVFGTVTTKSDLNIIDIIKLLLFKASVSEEKIVEKNIFTKLGEAERDEMIADIFEEKKIAQEKLSIEIVNSTDESGLGSRIARLITNIGGNVILVSTSQKAEDKSMIFYKKEKTYTLKRLREILHFPIQENQHAIGDITVRLGKDYNKIIHY
ncbi:MAG: LytR C-terminal domain-containing protein [Candidatus Pacearchaeota archaeon]